MLGVLHLMVLLTAAGSYTVTGLLSWLYIID